MNKAELVNAIAARSVNHYDAGVSKVVVAAVLDTLAHVAHAQLAKPGVEITVPGLGKFTVKARAARSGRNPATGEAMEIAARNVPHFTAAKALKDAVA
jgi:DNA-binding protein HU-beta